MKKRSIIYIITSTVYYNSTSIVLSINPKDTTGTQTLNARESGHSLHTSSKSRDLKKLNYIIGKFTEFTYPSRPLSLPPPDYDNIITSTTVVQEQTIYVFSYICGHLYCWSGDAMLPHRVIHTQRAGCNTNGGWR